MMKTAQTINGKTMYDAIAKMDTITFALIVGGYAHAEGDYSDGYWYVVSKWWKYCDEIATWLLSEDYATATVDYGLVDLECATCEECYAMPSPYTHEINHDSDCSEEDSIVITASYKVG